MEYFEAGWHHTLRHRTIVQVHAVLSHIVSNASPINRSHRANQTTSCLTPDLEKQLKHTIICVGTLLPKAGFFGDALRL